ncbi:hypothetical protein M409DRAFT_19258 [Zasmidium cellare ATCC 36951]|uniref:Heterokaryon incompatibility domain-containing protein n=1 Tax=Zasmidium cellare ATCC 36951 TaxID=1080233 RepID=A0A6A6CT55_ZASCE|nr:uncharacterized protein M409DRAFT_19258 [Zasmidium cellare ATCC 36951]KAF2170437.1 hypothetical protein M409DRAFT_19258 [Zasmidium cellare ATCC 36951]
MQEAALAPSNTCYIASSHIPLLNLLRAFRWREYKYHYSAPADLDSTSVNTALRNILTLWRYADPSHGPYVKAQGASIADALVFARGLNSSQPRDHVFGLLGLIRYRSLPKAIMERLRPAYSRSVLDVFRDATVAGLIEKEGIPDLIFEEIVHRHDDGVSASLGANRWPSWVPKWSDARDLDDYPGRLNKWSFSASGHKPFDFIEVDDVTIQVRGTIIDEVASVTDIYRVRDWSQADNSQNLLSWLQEVDGLGYGHARPAINTVLLAGLNGEGRPATEQDLNAFETFREAIIKHQQHGPGSSCSTRVSEVFERMCNSRRFFRTARQGSIGIGPNFMRPRDKVVVVHGCRAPIIIRPLDEETHSVVGECYVHGIMNGEVMGKVHSMGNEMIKLT